jgi:arginase family enzyme
VRTGEVYKGQGMVTPENMHVMVSPFNELNVVDYGDIAVDQLSTERSVDHIREVVREIAAAGSIPMIVGGDHSHLMLEYAEVDPTTRDEPQSSLTLTAGGAGAWQPHRAGPFRSI